MSLILDGTNGLSDVDGSAATPAIRGTDANTGIFFPAADTIAFSEGGTEAMRITSTGSIGIGTSTPTNYGGTTVSINSAGESYLDMWYAGTRQGIMVGASGKFVMAGVSTNPLAFETNGAERMRILSTGNILSLAGGSTTATGTGIAFPATQSASSDANTLDDYEEGEFTPLINGVSLGTQTYIKIGQFVYININAYSVTVSSIGATTALTLSGLPFTKRTGLFALVISQYPNLPVTLGDGTGTSANLYTAANAQDYTAVTRNSYGGSAVMSFRFVFMYQANS
jgi:hypothetical protein